MKKHLSPSLLLVWKLAAAEAYQLRAKTIEPIHLLLALAKSVDLDVVVLRPKSSEHREEIHRELAHIHNTFLTAAIEVRAFRRKLRRSLSNSRPVWSKDKLIHRSTAAKKIFSAAEFYARQTGAITYPLHLLQALLFAEDPVRDLRLEVLGIDQQRLRKALRREIALRQNDVGDRPSRDPARWN